MKIAITGAAGMLGRKLAERIAIGDLPGVTEALLSDIVPPNLPHGLPGFARAVDIADPESAATLVADQPDIIFHLAAIVSGEAEADFDKGYAVNLDATRALFEAIRAMPDYCPRVVFASSIAVFGAPFPDQIDDEFLCAPRTSYGVQKAMGELLLNDYSRRGILDGVAIRLPTICIRPGAPNKAASGFCRWPTPCATGTRAPAPASASCSMRRGSTRRCWARGAPSTCRASAPRWPSRSRRCAASRATAPSP
jgi:nucleoside-diphosphate-sugar epimerase